MLGSMQASFGFPEQRDYGEVTATTIDDEVRSIVQAAFERTVALLKERREVLEVAARRLLEKETLNEHELLELVDKKVVRWRPRLATKRPRSSVRRTENSKPNRIRKRRDVA